MSLSISIGIHQPNFLPWFGFFHKVYLSDIFVLHDNIQYSKKSVLRRTYIRNINKPNEKEFITVPLKKCSDFSLIKNLEIDHTQNWVAKSLNKIRNTYSKTTFFEQNYNEVEQWFNMSKEHDNFNDYCSHLIKTISDHLEIETEFVKSSEIEAEGEANEFNLNLVKALRGTVYNSGGGADQYQLEDDYRKNNIDLKIIDSFDFISNYRYSQGELPFLNGLSIIDMIFNIEKAGIRSFFKTYDKIVQIQSK